MNKATPGAFLKLVKHPLKFRLFLLKNLPSAYFSGVRVEEANTEKCITRVPYKWFSTNPFRSTYFACLSMAAEMSTGVLAMAALYGLRPAVSMLVISIEGKFYKKATGHTYFACHEGPQIRQAVADAQRSGEARQVTVTSQGTNKEGTLVAEFFITWSFKRK